MKGQQYLPMSNEAHDKFFKSSLWREQNTNKIMKGKAKELFEEWVKIEFIGFDMQDFNDSLPSMQWGVYQDFADSLGYDMSVDNSYPDTINYNYTIFSKIDVAAQEMLFKTRNEARASCLEKLNELVNKN